MEKLSSILEKVSNSSKEILKLDTKTKNEMLLEISSALIRDYQLIIKANKIDLDNAYIQGMSKSMIDRLLLDKIKIENISNDIKKVVSLDDPIGEIIGEYKHPKGMLIKKERVPFGVIAAIYESRPNVSVDIACLCLKTSNACVLRGGKEAINTNKVLVDIMRNVIKKYVSEDAITLITDTNRELVLELIQSKKYVDLVIPRGGKNLINFVVENAKVPFIETGAGNCHIYVDDEYDQDVALNVIINAKTSKPSVCNAVESILVNDKIKGDFLKRLKNELDKCNVEIRGCNKTCKYINVKEASEEDFYQEYNDYIVSVKVVEDVIDAVKHINKYSTKHSDAIITTNSKKANLFLNEVDSACVYVNASTRFTDGGEFGYGAELGISTQKLHARGPMGLTEMTTYKYKIYGTGEVR